MVWRWIRKLWRVEDDPEIQEKRELRALSLKMARREVVNQLGGGIHTEADCWQLEQAIEVLVYRLAQEWGLNPEWPEASDDEWGDAN